MKESEVRKICTGLLIFKYKPYMALNQTDKHIDFVTYILDQQQSAQHRKLE